MSPSKRSGLGRNRLKPVPGLLNGALQRIPRRSAAIFGSTFAKRQARLSTEVSRLGRTLGNRRTFLASPVTSPCFIGTPPVGRCHESDRIGRRRLMLGAQGADLLSSHRVNGRAKQRERSCECLLLMSECKPCEALKAQRQVDGAADGASAGAVPNGMLRLCTAFERSSIAFPRH